MERKQLFIKSNPYTKEIEYSWWNSEDEKEELLNSDSKLTTDEFTKTTIRNKAVEIIEEINKDYNFGGLDIVFSGTKDDFELLNNVLESYFPDSDIECKEGKYYIDKAEYVIPKIEEKFKLLKNDFNRFKNEEIGKEIANYSDVIRPSITICVVGLYSTGKSAFINSIIGKPILPSASDPTTAKNYKVIDSDGNDEIIFEVNGEKILFSIEDSKYVINNKKSYNILNEIKNKLEQLEELSSINIIYKLLEVLNKSSNTNENETVSDLIEIHTKFEKTNLPTDKYQFIIYDTPGSNSEHNKEHMDVLKNSLADQTNGLPIFITNPDDMDSKDNNEVIEVIEELGGALDLSNTVIVVNRADEKDDETLQAKKNNVNELRVTKWHSTRILFASSIIGIAAKLDNPHEKKSWPCKNYHSVFYDAEKKFSDLNHPYYSQLFKYNILPRQEYEKYITLNDANNNFLLVNSGVYSVELAIKDFSEKSAAYNKCIQASEFLNNSISLTLNAIENAEKEQEEINKNIEKGIDKKEKQLKKDLIENCNNLQKEYNVGYTEMMETIIKKIYLWETEADELRKKWSSYNKKKERNEGLEKYIVNRRKLILDAFKSDAYRESQSYWKTKQQEFKDSCIRIVTDSSSLTKEQKDDIAEEIYKIPDITFEPKNFNLYDINAYKPIFTIFGFKFGEKLDLQKCINGYLSRLEEDITTINGKTILSVKDTFKDWIDSLINKISEKLTSYNPLLKEELKKLKNCNKKINEFKKIQLKFKNSLTEIKALFDYKEVNV